MMIVRPVIIEPLEREWNTAKATIEAALARAEASKAAPRSKAQAEAARVMAEWRERLLNFRVLDPACGSGNFLYLSLLALKDIEHRTNLEAEAMGLPREFPRVGPECVLGIELNPYAAELARVSVWIGEIQWMRRNGFDAARNPVLRSLDTIECRDAVLATDDSRAAWPAADAAVGNPPFLGSKKMNGGLGEAYTLALRTAWPDVPADVDLVCYWFAQAGDMIARGSLGRAGFVATNSIRGGASRMVLKSIVRRGRIFDAWSDEGWTVEGAAVRVSLVCFDGAAIGPNMLNGRPASNINPDLTGSEFDLTAAAKLGENRGVCFEGGQKYGAFDIDGATARAWLRAPLNPNGRANSDVLRPYINATDLVRRPSDRWIIDFGVNMPLPHAMLYELPFAHVEREVGPYRATIKREIHRQFWWIHGWPRPELRAAKKGLSRIIITPVVAKYRLFAWMPANGLPTNLVDAIAREDDTTFGILHSRFHELWALRMGTSLEDRPRYTPSTTFETFPFPADLTPNIAATDYAGDPRAQAIAAAGARLNELRENWLNPADLIRREPEVVPSYPDRLLPIDEAAAKELAKRTLTNLYNARPAWLEHAHRDLDQAVADAYGWGDDFRAGTLGDDEILARLFRLNQERSGIEA